MHLREGEFSLAHTDFFEAFKNYDEAGSPRYLVYNIITQPIVPTHCPPLIVPHPLYLTHPPTTHRRLACLKYLVLANMLMKSGINPFDSTETKAYKNNPEVMAMTNLVR